MHSLATIIQLSLASLAICSPAPVPEEEIQMKTNLVVSGWHPANTSDCNSSSNGNEEWLFTYRTLGQWNTNFWGQMSGCIQQENYCLPFYEDVDFEDNIPDGNISGITRLSFEANVKNATTVTTTTNPYYYPYGSYPYGSYHSATASSASTSTALRSLNVYKDCACGTPSYLVGEGTHVTIDPPTTWCSFKIVRPGATSKRDEEASSNQEIDEAEEKEAKNSEGMVSALKNRIGYGSGGDAKGISKDLGGSWKMMAQKESDLTDRQRQQLELGKSILDVTEDF